MPNQTKQKSNTNGPVADTLFDEFLFLLFFSFSCFLSPFVVKEVDDSFDESLFL